MDESYLKLARSFVVLGDTIEMVCRLATPGDQRVAPLLSRAASLLRYGNALEQGALTEEPTQTRRIELTKAANLLFDASASLENSGPDVERVRAAVLSANSALSDVLPGIPDIPDLPKPEPVPPEDILAIARTGRGSHRTEEG